jgi:hypothetical protein
MVERPERVFQLSAYRGAVSLCMENNIPQGNLHQVLRSRGRFLQSFEKKILNTLKIGTQACQFLL